MIAFPQHCAQWTDNFKEVTRYREKSMESTSHSSISALTRTHLQRFSHFSHIITLVLFIFSFFSQVIFIGYRTIIENKAGVPNVF